MAHGYGLVANATALHDVYDSIIHLRTKVALMLDGSA